MVSFIHERMKFFFIHVPKTGGMSVSHFFFQKNLRGNRIEFSLKNSRIGIHDGVGVISSILGNQFEGYFSFAFYRNTWDWAYSLYRYIHKKSTHPLHERVKPLSFEQFVFHVAPEFYRPQKPLLTLDGKCAIRRLEDFRDFGPSFANIASELGFKNVEPEHRNAADSVIDYRTVYTKEMMVKIGDIYEEDIAYFNFKF